MFNFVETSTEANCVIATITLHKVIDDDECDRLRSDILRLIEGWISMPDKLIINFTNVVYANPTIVRHVLRWRSECLHQDVSFRLCCLCHNVWQRFTRAKVNSVFINYETVDDAIESI